MNNPFRAKKPPTAWERLTASVSEHPATETTRRALLVVGALVGASIISAVVSAVREKQED